MIDKVFNKLKNQIKTTEFYQIKGKVKSLVGLRIESEGPRCFKGEVCYIDTGFEKKAAEVVGFNDNKVMLLAYGSNDGIGVNMPVEATGHPLMIGVCEGLLGCVLDGLGNVTANYLGNEIEYEKYYPVIAEPPDPLKRPPINEILSVGIKTIDGLLTFGKGQRVGIFAGSGVGKSTLLGMLARSSTADVNVIGLIGERGKEVREFIERDLGEEGIKKSVVVVATSDKPAMVRLKAAFTATAIAEYFRDKGKDVLLMMDSITRLAMAQREIGLAAQEPPTTRGYPPSVFDMLPKLLERPGKTEMGTITAIYTVLVEGEDMEEPIADAVRGILDGHIVLRRSLANKGIYPAISVLESISRVMPYIVSQEHFNAALRFKELMAAYEEAEDLINIGSYRAGINKTLDEAVNKREIMLKFLKQGIFERYKFEETVGQLMSIVDS